MSLRNYFPESNHSSKKEFDDLLDKLYFHPHQFSSIVDIRTGEYFHISPSFHSITGYPVEELRTKGIGFFPQYVHEEDVLQALAIQAESLQQVFKPGFDPELSNIAEIPARLRRPDGTSIKIITLVMAMAYRANGMFDFTLGTGYATTADELVNAKKRREGIELLSKAKKLYRAIYPQPAFQVASNSLPTQILVDKNPKHALTDKEKVVLQKIAKGLSSKQIASDLNISENTIETHRKNILEKYEASNTAELIKRATKEYWLE